MRQILLIGLALINIMLVTSCEQEDDRAAPDTILETTWALTVTNAENVTSSSILKYQATTYNLITTYIKEGQTVIDKNSGTYTYTAPTVTMVPDIQGDVIFIIGTIYNRQMHITESSFVFDRQF